MMVFSTVGGLFTAIPAMAKVPSDFSPFNLPLQQAFLKLAFAPLVGLVGFVIVSSGELTTAAPTTWPSLALLAVVFGAGQQAITRYVDKRAGLILTSAKPPAGDVEDEAEHDD
jgi:hypothetical protein